MDKFSDMTLFASIIKNQGLAAAGRELGLSPAAVTIRLQALEERYRVKLLNRSTRHISLTDSGAMYYQACLEIIDSVKETENLLQTGTTEVRGVLKSLHLEILVNNISRRYCRSLVNYILM